MIHRLHFYSNHSFQTRLPGTRAPKDGWGRDGSRFWLAGLLLLGFVTGMVLRVPAAEKKIKVQLRNGDQVSGVLHGFEGRHLLVTSPYLGLVRLPLTAVSETTLDVDAVLVLKDGRVLKTRIRGIEKDRLRLAADDHFFFLDLARVDHIRLQSLPDTEREHLAEMVATGPARVEGLEEFRPKRWNANVDFGYTLNRSTTSSDDLFLRFQTAFTRKIDKFIVTGHIFYGVRDNQLSQKEIYSAFRYDYRVRNQFYVFGQLSGEYDAVERIDLRHNYNLGMGYHFYNRPDFQLSYDTGFGFQQELYFDDMRKTDGSGLVEQHLLWKLNSKLTLQHNFSLIPYVTGLGRYRFIFDTALRSKLTHYLSLNFGVVDKYDSRPLPDVRKNDFTALIGFGMVF